jgi:hypothetical protein
VSGLHLLDVMRDHVPMNDLVARVHEPVRVAARAAADVSDHGSGPGKRPLEYVDGADELHPPDTVREAITLLISGVVRLERSVDHAASCPPR